MEEVEEIRRKGANESGKLVEENKEKKDKINNCEIIMEEG